MCLLKLQIRTHLTGSKYSSWDFLVVEKLRCEGRRREYELRRPMFAVLEVRPLQAALERLADKVGEKIAFEGFMAISVVVRSVLYSCLVWMLMIWFTRSGSAVTAWRGDIYHDFSIMAYGYENVDTTRYNKDGSVMRCEIILVWKGTLWLSRASQSSGSFTQKWTGLNATRPFATWTPGALPVSAYSPRFAFASQAGATFSFWYIDLLRGTGIMPLPIVNSKTINKKSSCKS